MAEEVNLIVNVEGNGKKTVAEVRDGLKEAAAEAVKTAAVINDAFGNPIKTIGGLKDRLKELNGQIEKISQDSKLFKALSSEAELVKQAINGTTGGVASLKAQLKAMIIEMQGLDPSSARFKQLSKDAGELKDRIGDVNQRVNALSSDTKKLDALIGAGTAIAGGFQAASGAMALFGSNSKQVDEAIKNVIAVQGILNGVQQVGNFLTSQGIIQDKIHAAGKFVLTAATTAWTAAQRILNTVLKANPIGLLITGIAALGAGIVALINNIDSVIDWFGKLFSAMLFLEDEEAKIEANRARRAQANAAANKARLDEINAEREERKKQFNEEQAALDLEIAALEAVGKSSYALRLQKAQNRLADLKAELEHIGKVSESWTKYYEDQAVLSGQSREDFIKTLKGQGIDIESLTTQREALQKEVETSIRQSEIEISKIKHDEGVKQSAAQDKIDADAKAKREKEDAEKQKLYEAELDRIHKLQQERIDAILTIEQAENDYLDSLLTKQEQEENAVRDKYFSLIELAKEQGLETLTLEEAQQAALAEIRDRYREEEDKKDKEAQEKKKADQIALANSLIESTQNTLNLLESLNTLANSREIARINAKRERGEQLTRTELARLDRQAKIEKALAVGQIIVDGAKGIAGAISAGAAVPYPGNIIAIASGIASVVAATAVALQKVGSSESISVPSAGASTSGSLEDTADEVGGTTPNVRDLTGSTLLNPEPNKVYVVESEITGSQNNVKAIINEATYG